MAIARGAGTEIIRSVFLHNIADTAKLVIYGVRHHIYTVLSITANAVSQQAAGNFIQCWLIGYDANVGSPQQRINIIQQDMQVGETYLWNDKFSFNGYEPVDFTGPLDSEAKQDAIADQLVSGDSNRQVMYVASENADSVDFTCTFIDQNNA